MTYLDYLSVSGAAVRNALKVNMLLLTLSPPHVKAFFSVQLAGCPHLQVVSKSSAHLH